MTTEPKAALRDDIRLLGSFLGDTIKEQVSQNFYDTVEEIRNLSKEARQQGNKASDEKLKKLVRTLTDEEMLLLARSFGHFLNLANIAESSDFQRGISDSEGNSSSEHVEFQEVLDRLEDKDVDKFDIFNMICDMEIELVLTAHPTEVKRRTLIRKNGKISSLLSDRKTRKLAPHQKRQLEQELSTMITSIWQTDEIRRVRPTPVEEAKWGFAMIEETVWDAIPQYLRQLDGMVQEKLGKSLPLHIAPVKFASWMGGDRDGNPNVTHDVTRRVCFLSRWTAADLYKKSINELMECLSMQYCNDDLRKLVGDVQEPYRAYLRKLRDRFEATMTWCEEQLAGVQSSKEVEELKLLEVSELIEPLKLCYKSLTENKAGVIANGGLLDLIRRANCFGLALTTLDIRQESTRHTDVVNAITEHLGLGSYADWSEEEKQKFLIAECQNKRPLLPDDIPFTADQQEVIDTIKVVASLPSDSFGAYVISMASEPSDVLAVRLLQKAGGVKEPLRVAPLFETLNDLNNSYKTIDKLFSVDWYRAQISNRQEVMIGYSDSGKDAGKLAASWAQYDAMDKLTEVANRHNVKLTLFHGKGGSVGRGSGPVHHSLLAQPPGSVDGRMRVPEQGEVIQQKFSIKEVAVHNILQYVTAVTESTLNPPPQPKQEWVDIMNKMSETSCTAYRDVVRGHKDFVKYFRSATPEQELGRLYIGSRPAKRKAAGGIESLRAIPWIFAWTQTRLMLPAWLGIGKALTESIENGDRDTLQEMIQDWPFFYFFMDMIDMVLAKSDEGIAAYYDECLAGDDVKHLGEELRGKLRATIDVAQDIVKDLQIKEDRQKLRASIFLRNTYADPINLIQGEVLRRLRIEKHQETKALEDALMVTIAGIAAGMKNTG